MSIALRLKPDHDERPQAGDVLDCPEFHQPGQCSHWSNCDGHHILVYFPNGTWFDICSRASNCTMPEDRTHRCWVVHGELPAITVDKNGQTCQAGAGSFQIREWHGFIRNGALE